MDDTEITNKRHKIMQQILNLMQLIEKEILQIVKGEAGVVSQLGYIIAELKQISSTSISNDSWADFLMKATPTFTDIVWLGTRSNSETEKLSAEFLVAWKSAVSISDIECNMLRSENADLNERIREMRGSVPSSIVEKGEVRVDVPSRGNTTWRNVFLEEIQKASQVKIVFDIIEKPENKGGTALYILISPTDRTLDQFNDEYGHERQTVLQGYKRNFLLLLKVVTNEKQLRDLKDQTFTRVFQIIVDSDAKPRTSEYNKRIFSEIAKALCES